MFRTAKALNTFARVLIASATPDSAIGVAKKWKDRTGVASFALAIALISIVQ